MALRAQGGEQRCVLAEVSHYSLLFSLNLDHLSEESLNSGTQRSFASNRQVLLYGLNSCLDKNEYYRKMCLDGCPNIKY